MSSGNLRGFEGPSRVNSYVIVQNWKRPFLSCDCVKSRNMGARRRTGTLYWRRSFADAIFPGGVIVFAFRFKPFLGAYVKSRGEKLVSDVLLECSFLSFIQKIVIYLAYGRYVGVLKKVGTLRS